MIDFNRRMPQTNVPRPTANSELSYENLQKAEAGDSLAGGRSKRSLSGACSVPLIGAGAWMRRDGGGWGTGVGRRTRCAGCLE